MIGRIQGFLDCGFRRLGRGQCATQRHKCLGNAFALNVIEALMGGLIQTG